MQLRKQLSFILLGFVVNCVIAEWGYEGDNEKPDYWYQDFPYCAGLHQSPIDVVCDSSIYQDVAGPKITVLNAGNATLTNNMHSAQWTPRWGNVTLTGPTLSGTYRMAQSHFHWGTVQAIGSEHTLNGSRASLEMHMVFVADSYADLSSAIAANINGSVAVVAVLFEENCNDNSDILEPIVENIDQIDEPGATVNVPFIQFDKFNTNQVYEYSGSLTTPGCNEIVHWFILPTLHSINTTQIAKFRGMLFQDNSEMGNNYRPTQPLNGRPVFRNFGDCNAQLDSS